MKYKRIYIEITNQCNLTCDFCAKSHRPKRFMSVVEFKMICDQIRFFTDYIYLHVQGEPLLHPDLKEILEIANQNKLQVQLVTNGTMLHEKIDSLINSPAIRQVSISLQSMQTIGYLEDSNNRARLLNQLTQLAESGKIVQIRLWNFSEQVFTNGLNNCLSFFNIEMDDLFIEKKRYLTNTKNVYFSLDKKFQWPSDPVSSSRVGTCYGTRTMLGILSDGTLVPCCLDHDGAIALGNVFSSPFSELIDSSRLKIMNDGFNNRKLIESFCQHCEFRSRFD
ncbi:MAG: radical SAM/SPASM domain-containing protein [Erysipelotrichaceae bacterium]|nr:radical SAM/SPASM domain-containing protein [Erysipelotrichaceae bacterium]